MIVLDLARAYFGEYTIGDLSIDGVHLAHSLELPWQDNRVNVSCIAEGWYPLRFRKSPRFGQHLHVQDVPGRKWILFHAANDARKELRGCIAPVMQLQGQGKGIHSLLALELILYNLSLHDPGGLFLRVHEKAKY